MTIEQKEVEDSYNYMTKYFKKDDINRKKAANDKNVPLIAYIGYLMTSATKDILNAVNSTGNADLELARRYCDRVKSDVLNQLVEEGYN